MSFIESWKWEDYGMGNDVPDGTYEVMVKRVSVETSPNGKRFVKVSLWVNTPQKTLPYDQSIYESDYFNKGYSRYMDCFDIPHVQWQNLSAHIGKRGVAKFEHKQNTWIDSATGEQKSRMRCECLFIVQKEAGATVPPPQPQQQPRAAAPQQQAMQAQATQARPAVAANDFPEDIPF